MALRKLNQMLYFITGFISIIFFANLVTRLSDGRKDIYGLYERKVDRDPDSHPRLDVTVRREIETQKSGEDTQTATRRNYSRNSSKSQPIYLLVLSSLPRSGSTFFTEFLGTIRNSVVFFEPLWMQQRKPCLEDEKCTESFLMDIFACNYTSDFEEWLKSKLLFVHYFNSEVFSCFKQSVEPREVCVEKQDLRSMCSNSPVRIMKVIRARIKWFERVLQNSSVNFKLIYLTRDPRGSINSISKFPTWNKDPFELCSSLDADMEWYDLFSKHYPSKILHVSYEKFSLNPYNETPRIFEFLSGDRTVPPATKRYLRTHTTKKRGDRNMSTYKDSKKEFEAWRWKIADSLLKSIEYEPTCKRAIERMNHSLFNSVRNVRNESIPLIKP